MTIEQLKAKLAELRSKRDEYVASLETIVNAATAETRDFTNAEAEQRGGLTVRIEAIDEQITDFEDQVRQAEQGARDQRALDMIAQTRRDLGLGDLPANDAGADVTVTNEHRTYERGNGISYLKDLCYVSLGAGPIGPEYFRALERLQTHGRENHVEALAVEDKGNVRSAQENYFLSQMIEVRNDRNAQRGSIADRHLNYRALSTAATAGGEFVPPMYLTSEWIKFLRAGRVVADNCHIEPLPDGTMSINIPKVTSGTSVGTQGTENTPVSMTDLQTAYITFPVVTKAGQQVISLQELTRSPVEFDRIVSGDLALAYAQAVDVAVINGNGGGDVTGILNTSGITTVTWTQASPTVGGFYGRVGVAKRGVATSLYLPATHGFVTPDAWEWISQTFDTTGRPLVVPSYAGPFNAIDVTADDATAEGVVGRRLNGLATFEDANLPTISSNDVAIVSRMEMNNLYESPIVNRALPQTYGQTLSVLLQVFGYIAFTAARNPTANVVITGTGMATPRTYQS